jgi:hypothetical protein
VLGFKIKVMSLFDDDDDGDYFAWLQTFISCHKNKPQHELLISCEISFCLAHIVASDEIYEVCECHVLLKIPSIIFWWHGDIHYGNKKTTETPKGT